MLIINTLAEAVRLLIEHVPTLALLLGAPIGIITLGVIAIAIATFIDRQLPSNKLAEPTFHQEAFKQ